MQPALPVDAHNALSGVELAGDMPPRVVKVPGEIGEQLVRVAGELQRVEDRSAG